MQFAQKQMKHFKHLLSSKVYRQSGMSVKFHPVVQIKLILIKKKKKEKKKKKAHRGISSIQTVTLLDLSIYFRSMYTGNSHHSEGASVVLCLLGWWNWSHCAIKKHVGKYCKHCVRSDCAKQPPLCTSKHQWRSKQQCCRLPTRRKPPFFYRFCTKIQVENHDTLKSPQKWETSDIFK